MGLKEFQIVFDNELSTYYSGQRVTVRLLLNVDAPKKLRRIVIRFKGEAATKWTKRRKRRRHSTHYYGSEVYFEDKHNVFGESSGETILQPGEYCYTFNTVLPLNLPSSFEGKYGYVRYTVKATIDRPWKFDQETKAAFTIISKLDLNFNPALKDPIQRGEEKYFCFLCCKSGHVALDASLPYSGYVSGQKIPITVEVDNVSKEEISDVVATLRKHVVFTATYPYKAEKHDKISVAEISLGSVGKNSSQILREVLPIPPLPPSDLDNCSLIALNYDLKIEGIVSSMCACNVDLKIPLVIGTIPFADFQPSAPMAGSAEDGKVSVDSASGGAASVGVKIPAAGAGWPVQRPGLGLPSDPMLPAGTDPVLPGSSSNALYPNIPPPTYAEAVSGANNIQDDEDSEYIHGNMDFTPRYPVYNYPNPFAHIQ